jgi:hypothetical protein
VIPYAEARSDGLQYFFRNHARLVSTVQALQ